MMLTIVSKVMLMMTADDVNDNEMMMTMMLMMLVSKVMLMMNADDVREG